MKSIKSCQRRSRTTKEFWDDICQPLVTNNEVNDYELILDWVRVACTYSSPDTNALLNGTQTALLADEKLFDRAHEVIQRNLPGLQQATTPRGSTARADQIANAIRSTSRPQKKGLSPVSEKFAGTFKIIRSISEVEHEVDFPPFWIKFANASKAERATVYEETDGMHHPHLISSKCYPEPDLPAQSTMISPKACQYSRFRTLFMIPERIFGAHSCTNPCTQVMGPFHERSARTRVYQGCGTALL